MKYSIPKLIPATLLERVQAAITEQPNIKTADLAVELGVRCFDLEVPIHRLRTAGKIHRSNGLDQRRAQWAPGPTPDYDPGEMPTGFGKVRQRTVTAWPARAPRDPWIWALHGAQP